MTPYDSSEDFDLTAALVGRASFIVFEGLDGAGTTTQMHRLAAWLRELMIPVETTSEPTTGPIGSVIRQVIDGRLAMDPDTLALMFAADRSDHIKNPVRGIEKTLDQGTWVISDRYVFSSLAYQASSGISTDWIVEINRQVIAPDVTIFVDTDPAVCMERIRSRSQRDELYHHEDKLRHALGVYRKVLDLPQFAGHLFVVDGNEKVDDVFEQVRIGLLRWIRDR